MSDATTCGECRWYRDDSKTWPDATEEIGECMFPAPSLTLMTIPGRPICAPMRELLEVERERDKWLKWAATVDCPNPKWPPVSATSESSDCGECVPCQARAALKGRKP